MKRLPLILGYLGCLTLLIVLPGCATTATSPTESPAAGTKPGTTQDDAQITDQVKDAIFHTPYLRSSQISVRTEKGVVRLTGTVEKSLQAERATAVAGSVPGVVRVQNDLTVKE